MLETSGLIFPRKAQGVRRVDCTERTQGQLRSARHLFHTTVVSARRRPQASGEEKIHAQRLGLGNGGLAKVVGTTGSLPSDRSGPGGQGPPTRKLREPRSAGTRLWPQSPRLGCPKPNPGCRPGRSNRGLRGPCRPAHSIAMDTHKVRAGCREILPKAKRRPNSLLLQ